MSAPMKASTKTGVTKAAPMKASAPMKATAMKVWVKATAVAKKEKATRDDARKTKKEKDDIGDTAGNNNRSQAARILRRKSLMTHWPLSRAPLQKRNSKSQTWHCLSRVSQRINCRHCGCA